jgi:hypothetical protein
VPRTSLHRTAAPPTAGGYHPEEAPSEQRDGHSDDNEEERQRRAIPVLAALEGAPVDVKGVNRRVVERAAFGEEEDVFEAHQERERLVDRHEADRLAQRGKRDEAYLRQRAGAVDLGGVEQVLGNAPYRGSENDHPQRRADEAV